MAKYTFAAALLALALGKSRSIFFDTVHEVICNSVVLAMTA